MFKLAFVLVFAISFVEVFSKNDLQLKDIVHFKRILEGDKCQPFESIINKAICEIKEEEWVEIKDCTLAYGKSTGEINVDTGVFNLEVFAKIRSKKDMNMLMASICREKQDEQSTVDLKILNTYKHLLRRIARCSDVKDLSCEEACRKAYPNDAEFKSNNPCKLNA